MKLLMVAFYYPPNGGGAVQRTVKFAKYLPHYGIEPIILTSVGSRKRRRDQSFKNAFNHKVIRAKSIYLPDKAARLAEPFLAPDVQRLWSGKATKLGLINAVREKVDAIYSTSMPYSNHVVAHAIAKQLNLPWVADFRDLWTKNALYEPRAPWMPAFHKKLEEKIYREADHIVCASPSHKKIIQKAFDLSDKKVSTITNGFDPDDFQSDSFAPNQSKKITITYYGSFYGAYRPDDFIEALLLLKKIDPRFGEKYQFNFYGEMDRQARSLLDRSEVSNFVARQNYVPHAELPQLRSQSHALLVYLPKIKGPIGASTPQKVFDYLATRKPILAMLPPSDSVDILKKTGGATIIEPGDPEKIAENLKIFLTDLAANKLEGSKADLQEYSRPKLTEDLAKIIDEIVNVKK